MSRVIAAIVCLFVALSGAPPQLCDCHPTEAQAETLSPCCQAAQAERALSDQLLAPCASGCCDPTATLTQAEPPARQVLDGPPAQLMWPLAAVTASTPPVSLALANSQPLRGPPPPAHARRLATLQLLRC